jgi:hypothetical protein
MIGQNAIHRSVIKLTDLAEARGKQDLFTCQSPHKLKALREYALVEQPAIGLFAELGRQVVVAPHPPPSRSPKRRGG